MSLAGIRAAFEAQARACDELGSPFTARLCRLTARNIGTGMPLSARLAGWEGDPAAAGDSVPLRWCGALHALRLSGRAPGLDRVYPPAVAGDGALWGAVADALHGHESFVDRFLDSPPQTNEVGRAAVLIAAAAWLADRYGLPLVLSELGASAGLNLNLDRYRLDPGGHPGDPADPVLALAPRMCGALPPATPFRIVGRRGVDLHPADPADPVQALRLRAYVWPDQAARIERLDRALALPPAPVDRGDAAPWLASRLAVPHPGALHLVFHTIAWQYFPRATRAACVEALAAAGARATPGSPLARLAMEADGRAPGAAVSATLWPGGRTVQFGRADYHGRWLDWQAPQGA